MFRGKYEIYPLVALVGSAITGGAIFAMKKLYDSHPWDHNHNERLCLRTTRQKEISDREYHFDDQNEYKIRPIKLLDQHRDNYIQYEERRIKLQDMPGIIR